MIEWKKIGGANGMEKRLSGKSALVTGGSRGLGRVICLALANAGAAVIVNYAHNTDRKSVV